MVAASCYWLRSHVFTCVRNDEVILLDLNRDQYIAVAAPYAQSLSRFVQGWPVCCERSGSKLLGTEELMACVRAMAERGLITDDVGHGKGASPISIPEPTDLLALENTRRAIRCTS